MRYCVFAAILLTAAADTTFSGELRYRLTDLGDLPGGANESFATSMNDAGQVVGVSAGDNGLRAFLWQDGVMADLGTLGGDYSFATAISEQGEIVGESRATASGVNRAFRWSAGEMHDIGTLGGASASATGINSLGEIVGAAEDEAGETHAFVWRSGAMDDLGTLGGRTGIAEDINDHGLIVGASTPSDGAPLTGFVWSGQSMTPLREPPLSGGEQVAASVNDAGRIAGYVVTEDGYRGYSSHGGEIQLLDTLGGPHSFAYFVAADGRVLGDSNPTSDSSYGHATVWAEGLPLDLNTVMDATGEGWTLNTARSMNSAGQIVGSGVTPDGATRGFLLTPYFYYPPIPGDTDADGDVDLEDLNNVRNHFGEGVILGPPVDGESYPFDGIVDLGDLNRVRNYFGSGTTTPLPEPSSLVLLAIAGVVASLRRRWYFKLPKN